LPKATRRPCGAAAQHLAFGAADLIVAACAARPQARLPWGDTANRPVLRIVSQAISLALDAQDEARAQVWMRWMLARNPEDNHGWRELLRRMLLREGDAAGALALLDAYPGDMPPSGHDRALALFLLGRRDEAAQVLRQAHADFPAFVAALLPQALDRPAGDRDGLLTIGDAEHAWEWRGEIRSAWAASGALDWLRTLKLPRRPRRAARPAPAAASAAQGRPRNEPERPSLTGAVAALRPFYGARLPWLLGWLAACAWAPGLVMPSLWIGDAIEQVQGDLDPQSVQSILDSMMALYNHLNEQRLHGRLGSTVPLPDTAVAAADDAGWVAFAAGFVQFCETHGRQAWRRAGLTLDVRKGPFAPLYRLAARWPAAPGGWRAGDAQGQPLLQLLGDEGPARELLAHALQPLWQQALQAR
jgi:hypothetical protein